MSVSNEFIKNTASMAISDEDYFSLESEKSHKKKQINSETIKTLPSIINKLTNEKNEEQLFKSKDQSTIGTFYISDETEIDNKQTDILQQHLKNELTPISSTEISLATIPILKLSDHDYELHNIKLMKSSKTTSIDFTLIEQTNPLQYIITGITEQSEADIAGLKMNDWLIKIEDNDIRLSDLHDILKNIQQLLNNKNFINILIARKKSTIISSNINDQQKCDLSNSIKNEDENESIIQFNNTDKDKIRHIILKETPGIHFKSFISDNNNNPIQIHFLNNIQPISKAYRFGLRNNDCILTINNIDVTNMKHEDVQVILLEKKSIELTVINDPKYLELIENFKYNQDKIILSSSPSNYESLKSNVIGVLFSDDKGPVYIKHCVIEKYETYDALGIVLHYDDDVHIISNIEDDFPAYNSGLRIDDVVLLINERNIEKMTHDNVIMLLRSLFNKNRIIDVIGIHKDDIIRYKNYQKTNFIDWKKILSNITKDDTNRISAKQRYSSANYSKNASSEMPTFSLLAGARICNLEPSNNRTAGFMIEDNESPPFTIYAIEKDSPAEKAGLQLNDVVLSVNGKSVMETSYENTVKIIKEALQQKTIQFVVNQLSPSKEYKKESESQLSTSTNEDYYMDNNVNNTRKIEPSQRGGTALQEYQRQRSKELSHILRLCHLNATNIDGTPASTFGFEITQEADYEYPIISHVEPKSPGDCSGLQLHDILLKVNKRKTKGLNFDKVKKAIEKAKRDGRLEMLVIDKESFNYCIQTNKKLKEPYIKVKHIFPRSRSTQNFQKLHSTTTTSSSISQNSIEHIKNDIFSSNKKQLSISKEEQFENEEDDLIASKFKATIDSDSTPPINSSNTTCAFFLDNDPPTSMNYELDSSEKNISTIHPNVSKTSHEIKHQTTNDESIVDVVLNVFNNFRQNIGSEKSTKPNYDISLEQKNNINTNPLLPKIIHHNENKFEDIQHISQMPKIICSNQLNESYDYIRDPRRCILKIDRNKGLGFILSAIDDYDHIITAVEKNSIADEAGLQINDEVIEINNVNVRNIKYEKVVDMLISAIRTNDTIEMCVINNHSNEINPSIINKNIQGLLNGNNNNNNNNNNNLKITTHNTTISDDNLSENNSFDQRIMARSYSNLHDQTKYSNNIQNCNVNGIEPKLSTGITASPKEFSSFLSESMSTKNLNISKKDAPIARLCRIQKFPSSPFYGFFLCGDRKKLGHVFISHVAKNSSAAICGLRDDDYIIEINGTNIKTLTYETILSKIKFHMDYHNLELLVLNKKSVRWYRERNYPITSQTLPTIIHIEPIINNINYDIQTFQHISTDDFVDRQVLITSL